MMKHRKIIIFVILIIILGILIFKVGIRDKDKLVVKYYEEYTVMPGENLWTISKKYPHGDDIRDFIYIIKDNNNTTALVQSGQTLLIPIIEQ